MISTKEKTLKPLIASTSGLHLTAYIKNQAGQTHTQDQLRKIIREAHEFLTPTLSLEERIQFLQPLQNLVDDTKILKRIKHNIGIFRTKDSFRILNLPVAIETSCQVATTFHVKPLLRWLQADREFLVLGIEKDTAHLYLGNQQTLQKIDSVFLPKSWETSNFTFTWFNTWLGQMTLSAQPQLFIAGAKTLTTKLARRLKYEGARQLKLGSPFNEENLSLYCDFIRRQLENEAKLKLKTALIEFKWAEDLNLAHKNIFQIAKAAVKGKVKKLLIASEFNIFGKIDKKSGGLRLHPADLDHEDDDILDDLAQMVLLSGGEVYVVPKEQMPKSRPLLAILTDESPRQNKVEPIQQYENKPKEQL